MNILVVEDNRTRRDELTDALDQMVPSAHMTIASSAEEAMANPVHGAYDVAFLDIGLPGMSGLELAHRLQAANQHINLIFVTAHSEFMADALAMHCSGYILKPVTPDKVRAELEALRWPVFNRLEHISDDLYMRCFGSFEAFYAKVPLRFKHRKTKELLAYLVAQHGSMSSVGQIESVLWEMLPYTSSHQSYLRHMVCDLRDTLTEVGVPDALVRRRGSLGVAPATFSCDYYDYLDGKPQAVPYTRSFMSQYPWAEEIQAELFFTGDSAVPESSDAVEGVYLA